MSNPTGARAYWDPGRAAAPKRGLFSLAQVVDNIDPHLLMGAEYLTNRCQQGKLWIDLCAAPNTGTKEFHALDIVIGDPFTVYDGLECPLVGVSAEESVERLRESFEAKAEAGAEAQLQQMIENYGYSVIESASLADAVGDLEEQLAQDYAGVGLLHFDRHTAIAARSRNILTDPDSLDDPARTINGTPAVMGRGYSQNADKYWVGATGRVSILRGPLLVNAVPPMPDAPARVLAEQTMVMLVECTARWAESVIA